ncbi:hypothetical protein, partial [Streptomyces sp. NPDC002172]
MPLSENSDLDAALAELDLPPRSSKDLADIVRHVLLLDRFGLEDQPVNDTHIQQLVREMRLIREDPDLGDLLSADSIRDSRRESLQALLHAEGSEFHPKNSARNVRGRAWNRTQIVALSGIDLSRVILSRYGFPGVEVEPLWRGEVFPVVADFDKESQTVVVFEGVGRSFYRLTPPEFAELVRDDPIRPAGKPVILVGNNTGDELIRRLVAHVTGTEVYAYTSLVRITPEGYLAAYQGNSAVVPLGRWVRAEHFTAAPEAVSYSSRSIFNKEGESAGRSFVEDHDYAPLEHTGYQGLADLRTYWLRGKEDDKLVKGSETPVPWPEKYTYFVDIHGLPRVTQMTWHGTNYSVYSKGLEGVLRRRPSLQEMAHRSKENGRRSTLVGIACFGAAWPSEGNPDLLGEEQPLFQELADLTSDLVDEFFAATEEVVISGEDATRPDRATLSLPQGAPKFTRFRPMPRGEYLSKLSEIAEMSEGDTKRLVRLLRLLFDNPTLDDPKAGSSSWYPWMLRAASILNQARISHPSGKYGGDKMMFDDMVNFLKDLGELYIWELSKAHDGYVGAAIHHLHEFTQSFDPAKTSYGRWVNVGGVREAADAPALPVQVPSRRGGSSPFAPATRSIEAPVDFFADGRLTEEIPWVQHSSQDRQEREGAGSSVGRDALPGVLSMSGRATYWPAGPSGAPAGAGDRAAREDLARHLFGLGGHGRVTQGHLTELEKEVVRAWNAGRAGSIDAVRAFRLARLRGALLTKQTLFHTPGEKETGRNWAGTEVSAKLSTLVLGQVINLGYDFKLPLWAGKRVFPVAADFDVPSGMVTALDGRGGEHRLSFGELAALLAGDAALTHRHRHGVALLFTGSFMGRATAGLHEVARVLQVDVFANTGKMVFREPPFVQARRTGTYLRQWAEVYRKPADWAAGAWLRVEPGVSAGPEVRDDWSIVIPGREGDPIGLTFRPEGEWDQAVIRGYYSLDRLGYNLVSPAQGSDSVSVVKKKWSEIASGERLFFVDAVVERGYVRLGGGSERL